MESKLLSIITPSYNQSGYISKNIESVLSQSNNDIEHIIIDGGSDDDTLDILREYEDSYNLRWVSEPDRGQTHAINKGFQMANGEWIGWQNSDDFYQANAFKIFRKELKKNPQADAIYGDLVIVDEKGEPMSKKFTTRPSKFVQRQWSLFASNQSLFIRRSVLEEIFPLDEELEYTMDAELTWKLLDGNYNLVHVAEALGAFRIQPEAKTFEGVQDLQDEELRQIYGHRLYQQIVPSYVLENMAKATKAVYLLLDRRFDAILHNVVN
ncbi:glycosyltransferase family 2 protein [Halorubrum ezzemoulense]|nr:glycosyltransferase family 2 protein [Halorubrum ezzemoulense]